MSKSKWTIKARSRIAAILAAFAIVLGTVTAITVTSAAPAHADNGTGTYNNATIATTALNYVDQWGGNACKDAGLLDNHNTGTTVAGYGGGQCRTFVNCVVYLASGGAQYPTGSDYFTSFTNAGAVEITSIDNLAEGDIVQNGEGSHTFIIVSRVGTTGTTFNVVDSNYASDEMVKSHQRTFTLSATQRAFRMATVSSSGGSGGTTPPPPPSQPDLLLALVGNTLYAKANIGDQWTTETNAATGVQASGGRIGITDTSGNLEVKDGPNGAWVTETGAVDQYVVTPNLLVIRVGGTVYAKAQLTDAWTTEVGGGATSIQAAGNTLTFLDSSGNLWAKVGVGGTWQEEIGSVTQYVLTSSLLLTLVGNTLYAKANIGDAWAIETNAATQVKASGGRIGITDTSGNLEAKDGINGSWVTETGATDQSVLTPNLLILRIGSTVYAKVQLTDAWTTETTSATNVQATNNTMAYLDSNSNLWAQIGVNGGWLEEIGSVSAFAVS